MRLKYADYKNYEGGNSIILFILGIAILIVHVLLRGMLWLAKNFRLLFIILIV